MTRESFARSLMYAAVIVFGIALALAAAIAISPGTAHADATYDVKVTYNKVSYTYKSCDCSGAGFKVSAKDVLSHLKVKNVKKAVVSGSKPASESVRIKPDTKYLKFDVTKEGESKPTVFKVKVSVTKVEAEPKAQAEPKAEPKDEQPAQAQDQPEQADAPQDQGQLQEQSDEPEEPVAQQQKRVLNQPLGQTRAQPQAQDEPVQLEPNAVTDVALSPPSIDLAVGGDPVKLTATVTAGSDSDDKRVTWSVNPSSAVSLYEDEGCTRPVSKEASNLHEVYAKGTAAGDATITVTSAADGQKSASSTAHVKGVYQVTTSVEPTGGGTASADPSTAAEGDQVTLTATPASNYEFVEWRTDPQGVTIQDNKLTMPASDVTVTAVFREKAPETCTITFDAHGGKGTMAKQTADKGTTVTLTANAFKRSGYSFTGWNTKANGSGTAYKDKAQVKLDKDMTLYAQWKKNAPAKCTITFDANGGSGTMAKQTGDKDATVTLASNVFKRSGYTFVGWNTTRDGKGTNYANKAQVKLSSSMTLYAQWKKSPGPTTTYTITYAANGGTGTMAKQTGNKDATVTLTANTFKRTGYTFSGWNTKQDGTGTKYSDKAQVKLSSNMTLYAQWTKGSAAGTTTKTGDTLMPLVIAVLACIAVSGALAAVAKRRME